MAAANNVSLSAERLFDADGFKKKIKAALNKANGNVAGAAKILGVSRSSMVRWIRESRDLRMSVRETRSER